MVLMLMMVLILVVVPLVAVLAEQVELAELLLLLLIHYQDQELLLLVVVMVVMVVTLQVQVQTVAVAVLEAMEVWLKYILKHQQQYLHIQHLVVQLLGMNEGPVEWEIPVCQTNALQGEGVAELQSHLERHRAYLQSSGAQHEKRRLRARRQVESLMAKQVMGAFWTARRRNALEDGLESVPPYQLASTLLDMS